MSKLAKIDRTKKPTNVTLSQDLVAEAKRLGINLSQACERGLRDQVAETAAHKWQQDNKAAIAASNAFAEQNDLPLTGQRLF